MGDHANGSGRCDHFPQRIQFAIEILRDASDYAHRTTGDLWEFAVEIQELRDLGLAANDLRFLVLKQAITERSFAAFWAVSVRRTAGQPALTGTVEAWFWVVS